jgi:hypothetical protein
MEPFGIERNIIIVSNLLECLGHVEMVSLRSYQKVGVSYWLFQKVPKE